MNWLKKLLGLQTYNEVCEDKVKQEKTLEEWRSEAIDLFLRIRGCEDNEAPYVTYFFKYCSHCNEFLPWACFTKDGKVEVDRVLTCSKIKLNIKLLQDESKPKCNCNSK